MKFDYKHIGIDENGEEVIRPIIPIRLRNGEQSIQYEVLVDSGSDRNIFDADIAEVLGLELEKGREGYFQGVTGSKQVWYTHGVEIEVAGQAFDTEASFAHLPDPAHGIVGQRGFFEYFGVEFIYQEGRIELS